MSHEAFEILRRMRRADEVSHLQGRIDEILSILDHTGDTFDSLFADIEAIQAGRKRLERRTAELEDLVANLRGETGRLKRRLERRLLRKRKPVNFGVLLGRSLSRARARLAPVGTRRGSFVSMVLRMFRPLLEEKDATIEATTQLALQKETSKAGDDDGAATT